MMFTSRLIPGGFAKSWRKELHSDIWTMPPIYHRVWYWLRLNAQHETFLFPTRERFGIWVLPGQRITSLQQIADGVAWREWGKEKVPNKRTIKAVLDWMEVQEMVTVESNAKGTLITIVNWRSYNDTASKIVTVDSHAGYTRSAHKGEGVEGKEVKTSSAFFDEELDKEQGEPKFYLTAKKKMLTGERLSTFNEFMDVFNDKRGRAHAADAWIEIKPLTKSIFDAILSGARKYAEARPKLVAEGRTPKMAQGWLSGRRWEDEIESSESTSGLKTRAEIEAEL